MTWLAFYPGFWAYLVQSSAGSYWQPSAWPFWPWPTSPSGRTRSGQSAPGSNSKTRLPKTRPGQLAVACLIATTLAGCGTSLPASVTGECRVFQAPDRGIRGAAAPDQRWIDETIESGVAACDWDRPAR